MSACAVMVLESWVVVPDCCVVSTVLLLQHQQHGMYRKRRIITSKRRRLGSPLTLRVDPRSTKAEHRGIHAQTLLTDAATTTAGGSSKATGARWRSKKTERASSIFNATTRGSATPTPSPSSGEQTGRSPRRPSASVRVSLFSL